MSKLILAVNAGSSSLKFKIFEVPSERVVTSGLFERIGHEDGIFKIKAPTGDVKRVLPLPNHEVCVSELTKALVELNIVKSLNEISAVGHRVVQGGKHFSDSVIFTDEVAETVERLIPLAPLHNGPNLTGYRAFKSVLPDVVHVAVFDTSFHQTMEDQDYLFAIPYEYYTKYDIRRYGFHGTSHKYVSDEITKLHNGRHQKTIVCHLGNGASVTAVKDGKSIATSMGLTPLGGVMMGTRTGDLDPSIMYFVAKFENKTMDEVYDIFNKKSGMLGISGLSNDSRDVENAALNGNKRAILTEKLYARRVADYIGQYHIRLGGTEAIAFTAGIGENVPPMRTLILNEVKDAMGIIIDEEKNKAARGGAYGLITTPESKVKVFVIPTNEELMIVRDCVRLLKA
ncbi:MAG: acetate kinase [Bacilli bacterium]|nr:acetate kinase [Bacilli bacterium]